jgi:hypothetical protein
MKTILEKLSRFEIYGAGENQTMQMPRYEIRGTLLVQVCMKACDYKVWKKQDTLDAGGKTTKVFFLQVFILLKIYFSPWQIGP